jgi:hypothetical protein
MRHLYNSRVVVEELSGDFDAGTPTYTWVRSVAILDPALGVPGELMCRLDLNFIRPGKDQPQPIVAGRAPDRMGLMLFDATAGIKAGQRIRVIDGPAAGATFEIRAVPDPAQGFSDTHHMEVQVIEVAQQLRGVFPGTDMESWL